MPDPFFSTSKPKKRKRLDSTFNGVRPSNTIKPSRTSKDRSKTKSTRRDEDLSDTDGGDVDDMDLRAEEVDTGFSGDEDETEVPAEKRLRLAQLYLDSIKTSLGVYAAWNVALVLSHAF